MNRLRRLIAWKPLHFVIGGLLLHAAQALQPPAPVVPEPVALSAQAREQLRASWTANMGRAPDARELAALERQELDDEVLFREGLALGIERRDEVVRQRLLLNMRFLGAAEGASDEALLEQAYAMGMQRNDLVVRRRLVQVMEFALSDGADHAPISEQELADMYRQRREELAEPVRWRLVQVYFSADRRGAQADTEARTALSGIERDGLTPDQAVERGDPFLGGHRLPALGAPQLAAQFGTDFVAALAGCEVRAWCGPVRSAFGAHLVWIEERTEARIPPLEDPAVRARLESDVRRARAEHQLAQAIAELRRKYGVQG